MSRQARQRGRIIVFLLICGGCTTIKPLTVLERPLGTSHVFSHDDFDRTLRRFVDEHGRVDYTGLKNDSRDLDRYYLRLSTYSPDSHPALFPTEQSRLAYWLNAYNAAVIKAVLTHYPISSIGEVKPLFPLSFFLPDHSGFFFFQRVTFGGTTTSLYYLEHTVIRQRFADPRVHFALNCASAGCPRLPRYAFTAEQLDTQLGHEARTFVAEERNVRIDHQEKIILLSSIFHWYEQDFLTWHENRYPSHKATLLDYVALYAPLERKEELHSAASYQIRFVPYDWGLNDQ